MNVRRMLSAIVLLSLLTACPVLAEGDSDVSTATPLVQPGHYLPVVDLGEAGVVKAPPISLPSA